MELDSIFELANVTEVGSYYSKLLFDGISGRSEREDNMFGSGKQKVEVENNPNGVLGLQVTIFRGTIRVIKSKSRNGGEGRVGVDQRGQGWLGISVSNKISG